MMMELTQWLTTYSLAVENYGDCAYFYWAIVGALASILFLFIPFRIARFVKDRRQMKKDLRKKRDEMVSDLFAQLFHDKANLSREAMDARKNLVRAAFAANQMADRMSKSDEDEADDIND
jgi:uncharacterized membrane protein YccC